MHMIFQKNFQLIIWQKQKIDYNNLKINEEMIAFDKNATK